MINNYVTSPQIETLTEVANFLQSEDRNGEYLEMIHEFKKDELSIEAINRTYERVLNEWIEDLKTIEKPTGGDIEDIVRYKKWLNEL
ncbi:hypothetical protein AB1L05_16715 [Cytobacillus horneckiae]|uniref:hypothetical protein n=1 Tax=Cytobacillus horneckiae TaxID=549687 RepID=UPI0039A154E6